MEEISGVDSQLKKITCRNYRLINHESKEQEMVELKT